MCEYFWMADVGRFFFLLLLAFAYVTHIWPCDQIIDCAFFAARDILRYAVPLGTFKYTYCINIELLVIYSYVYEIISSSTFFTVLLLQLQTQLCCAVQMKYALGQRIGPRGSLYLFTWLDWIE